MDVDMSVRSAQVRQVFYPLILVSGMVFAQDQGDGSLSGAPDMGLPARQESASGSEGIHPYLDYRKRVETAQSISPLDNGVFGDQVSLYNGAADFSVTDIDVPGNNALAVQLGRRLSVELQPQNNLAPYDGRLLGMGNWDIDVPYVAAVYPSSSGWSATRCSVGSVPATVASNFYRAEYWQGITVHVPRRGTTSVMGIQASVPRPSSGTYRFTTAERDVFDCIPMKSGLAGEGFRMTTSSGVRYFFDVGVTRTAARLMKYVKPASDEFPIEVYLDRQKHYLLASRVEDRFGNTVEFQYNGNGHPIRIWSSDGREITLTYANGRLSSVFAHGRTWSYQYDTHGELTQVTNPDGSQWRYSYSGSLMPPAEPVGMAAMPWCSHTPPALSVNYTLTATHPSGMTGIFAFDNRRHFRSGVHVTECAQGGDPLDPEYTLLVPHYFDVMSVNSKTLSGPGMTSPLIWSYDYSSPFTTLWGVPTQMPSYPCTTCSAEKSTTVTNPDGVKKRHYFGMRYYDNDGRQLRVETLSATGTVVRTETSSYMTESAAVGQPFHGEYGSILGGMNDPASARIRPVVMRSVAQDGVNHLWHASTFDAFARPVNVTQSSAPSP
ncbi:RHS repeat domain-containing protein [Stenotrophomonas acidaminiphila]|uniref:RHS repeat domain-containing protein n=1 Tax=Stenotrophomonas acidaminiphila TaxID=128780 RepID=UPI0028A5C9DF|nr:hypothetical protein [Stenotrophomonas acidaminiphila]